MKRKVQQRATGEALRQHWNLGVSIGEAQRVRMTIKPISHGQAMLQHSPSLPTSDHCKLYACVVSIIEFIWDFMQPQKQRVHCMFSLALDRPGGHVVRVDPQQALQFELQLPRQHLPVAVSKRSHSVPLMSKLMISVPSILCPSSRMTLLSTMFLMWVFGESALTLASASIIE